MFDFFPFGRTLKQNLYFYFNPVNNKEKISISTFRLPSKTEKLSHATDCNIVGETK